MKVFWKLAVASAVAASCYGAPAAISAVHAANITISDDAPPVPTPAAKSADPAPKASPTPAPKPMVEHAPAPMAMPEAAPASEECEGGDECPAWELFGTNCHGVHVGGWINGGYVSNNFGRNVEWNGPVSFNDRNESILQQSVLFIEKKLEADQCCLQTGGRIELLYGRDALFIQSTGLELNQDDTRHWNGQRFYGLAVSQAFVEFGRCDTSLKVGKMVTALEYEVIAAPGNFFYSHSYGFLYAVPFTHTGAMATHKVNDCLTVMGGVFNGWDHFDREVDHLALHGGFVYTPCHQRYTITGNIVSGDELDITDSFSRRTAGSLVFDYKVNECDQYVMVVDVGVQDRGQVNTGRQTGLEQTEWYGINNYFYRKVNDCLKLGVRAEWFRDDDGTRVTGAGDIAGNNVYQGGSTGNFYEVSLGANYTPHTNIWVRPEVRYDWFDGSGNRPFNNGDSVSQWTFSTDVIFTY